LATPSWKPIYNVESVDGDLWIKLKNLVTQHLHKIKLEDARLISSEMTKDLIKINDIITSEDISILSAKIFYRLVFQDELPKDLYKLFYEASIEWRKEIAIKGKGNIEIKTKFVNHLKSILNTDDIYVISSVAQPFFISPMINFSDIFVSIFKYKKFLRKTDITREYCKNVISESIRLQHPFPLLEREYETYRVYIELDNFTQDTNFNPDRWLEKEFGWGPRKCIGKYLALNIMSEILFEFLQNPSKIYPEIGHCYSGRNNDNIFSLSEIFYTLKTLGKLISGL
jgi:hypothetical protein